MDNSLSKTGNHAEDTEVIYKEASSGLQFECESSFEVNNEPVSTLDDEDDDAAEAGGRFLRTAHESAVETICKAPSLSESNQTASENGAQDSKSASADTNFECARLVFRNLPPDCSPAKVKNLLEKKVECPGLRIGEITDVVSGRCEVVVEPAAAASHIVLKLNGTLYDDCKLTVIKIITADGVKPITEKAKNPSDSDGTTPFNESEERMCAIPTCHSALPRGEVHPNCSLHSICFENNVFDPSVCEYCKEIFARGTKGDTDAVRLWKNKVLRVRKKKLQWVSEAVKSQYFLDCKMSGKYVRDADGTVRFSEKSFEHLCVQQPELSNLHRPCIDDNLVFIDEISHLFIWSARNMKQRTKGPQYRALFKNISPKFDIRKIVVYVFKAVGGVEYARLVRKRMIIEFESEEYVQKCINALNGVIFMGNAAIVTEDTDEEEQEEQVDEEKEPNDIVYSDDVTENEVKVEETEVKTKESDHMEVANTTGENLVNDTESNENSLPVKATQDEQVVPESNVEGDKGNQKQGDEFSTFEESEKVFQMYDDINHLIIYSFAKEKERSRGVEYRVFISDGPTRFDLRRIVVKLLEKVGGIVFARVRRRVMVIELETEELAQKCIQEANKFIIRGTRLKAEKDFVDHRRVLEERRNAATSNEVGSVEPKDWNALGGEDSSSDTPEDASKQLKKQKKAAAKEIVRQMAYLEENLGLPEGTLDSLNITLPLVKEVRVSNLPDGVTKDDIKELLSVTGVVQHVYMEPDRKAAVVEMTHQIDAVQAISQLHSQVYYDNPLTVELYRGKPLRRGDKTPQIPKGMKSIGKRLEFVPIAEMDGPKLNKCMRKALHRHLATASMEYSQSCDDALAVSHDPNTGLMGHSPHLSGANTAVGSFGLPVLKPVTAPDIPFNVPGKSNFPPVFRGGPNPPGDGFSTRGKKRKEPDYSSSFRNQDTKRKNPYKRNPNEGSFENNRNYNGGGDDSRINYNSGGYGSGNFGPGSHGSGNFGSRGRGPGNFGSRGRGSGNFGSRGRGSGNFGSGGHGPRNYGSGDHGPGNFGSGGHSPGNFGSSGHCPGNFDSGGHGSGNFDSGGHGPGNFSSEGPGSENSVSDNYGSEIFSSEGYGSGNYGSGSYDSGGYSSEGNSSRNNGSGGYNSGGDFKSSESYNSGGGPYSGEGYNTVDSYNNREGYSSGGAYNSGDYDSNEGYNSSGGFSSGPSSDWKNQPSGNSWSGSTKYRKGSNFGGSDESESDKPANQRGGGCWKEGQNSDGGWSSSELGSSNRGYEWGSSANSISGCSSSGRGGGSSYSPSGELSSSAGNSAPLSYPVQSCYNSRGTDNYSSNNGGYWS